MGFSLFIHFYLFTVAAAAAAAPFSLSKVLPVSYSVSLTRKFIVNQFRCAFYTSSYTVDGRTHSNSVSENKQTERKKNTKTMNIEIARKCTLVLSDELQYTLNIRLQPLVLLPIYLFPIYQPLKSFGFFSFQFITARNERTIKCLDLLIESDQSFRAISFRFTVIFFLLLLFLFNEKQTSALLHTVWARKLFKCKIKRSVYSERYDQHVTKIKQQKQESIESLATNQIRKVKTKRIRTTKTPLKEHTFSVIFFLFLNDNKKRTINNWSKE